MSWSTRQVAELAGTTLRTVRHYHDLGLLPEPERNSNGYKNYDVTHLVRILQIRNLVDLGFSLGEISEMDSSEALSEEALLRLDGELEATIDRLTRAREQVRTLLRAPGSDANLGSSMTALSGREFSERDQGFLTVFGRIAGEKAVSGFVDAVSESEGNPVLAELEDLPADADKSARDALVTRLAEYMTSTTEAHPELNTIQDSASIDSRRATEAINAAIAELYNPAQLDVIVRASAARRE